MQVVGDALRADAEEPLEMIDVALEGRIGRKVLQVAHVMAENRLPPRPRANATLSCPPTASVGRPQSIGSGTGCGA